MKIKTLKKCLVIAGVVIFMTVASPVLGNPSNPTGCRAESRTINTGVTTAYRVDDNDQYVYSGGAIETLQFTSSISVSQVKVCNSGRIISHGENRYYINTSVN